MCNSDYDRLRRDAAKGDLEAKAMLAGAWQHEMRERGGYGLAPAEIMVKSSPSMDLAQLAVLRFPSAHTRRLYLGHIKAYLNQGYPMSRDGVIAYVSSVRRQKVEDGYRENEHRNGAANMAIRAISAFAGECHARRLIDGDTLKEMHMPYIKGRGDRQGIWLSIEEAKRLVKAADRTTLQGKRDAAIIALLLGCAMRRSEVADVTWQHYQEREGRQVIVDLVGKGERVRTIPVPAWAQRDLDAWERACGDTMVNPHLPIVRRIHVGATEEKVMEIGISTQRIMYVVQELAEKAGIGRRMANAGQETGIPAVGGGGDVGRGLKTGRGQGEPPTDQKGGSTTGRWGKKKLSPHDLRRTAAKLMRRGGAEIEQIKEVLGHESVVTTERYLGGKIELGRGKAAVDRVDLAETEAGVETETER